jgi:hypothetical protein
MLQRYRKWRFDRIDRKQQQCSHKHMSASPEGWYWYKHDNERYGCLRCDACGAYIQCSHEHTVVYANQYSLGIFAPRLECADCNMPLKDPDMYGKDGAICSYDGHPEYNNTYRTETMNPGLKRDR